MRVPAPLALEGDSVVQAEESFHPIMVRGHHFPGTLIRHPATELERDLELQVGLELLVVGGSDQQVAVVQHL